MKFYNQQNNPVVVFAWKSARNALLKYTVAWFNKRKIEYFDLQQSFKILSLT